MDRTKKIDPGHFISIGTELMLCHGTRRVRVLTLPSTCNNWRLLRSWAACLSDDPDIIIEWPSNNRHEPMIGMKNLPTINP